MSPLTIETIVSPPLETNTFLAADPEAGLAVAIDPSFVGDRLIEACRDHGWRLKGIVLTHGHIDHTHDAGPMAEKASVPVIAHRDAAAVLNDPVRSGALWLSMDLPPCEVGREVDDGDVVEVGSHKLRVLHTPGHATGSICLLGDGVCFTGDLIFAGGIGRWDFPDGDLDVLKTSCQRFCAECPDDTTLYPGHGPNTTMAIERRENPYLLEWLAGE